MPEHFLTDINNQTDSRIIHQIRCHISQEHAHQINNNHGSAQHPEEHIIGIRQDPVDGDLEHPRHGEPDHIEDDHGSRGGKKKTAVLPENRPYLVHGLFFIPGD